MSHKPTLIFDDCWGSVGDTTYYHRGGKCLTRKRSKCAYPGTADQIAALAVHQRALAAWRSIDEDTQLQWGRLAKNVRPHRPPFDNEAHISGYNLFVSAYHGFATLGEEHTPSPQPFTPFPDFFLSLIDAADEDGSTLQLSFSLRLIGTQEYSRYRLLCKVQTGKPGVGISPGLMRNFLSESVPTRPESEAVIEVPADTQSGSVQVHMRYLLLDSGTGYRSMYRKLSFVADLQ